MIHVTKAANSPNANPAAQPTCFMKCSPKAVTPIATMAANNGIGLKSIFSEATVSTFFSLLGSSLLKDTYTSKDITIAPAAIPKA